MKKTSSMIEGIAATVKLLRKNLGWTLGRLSTESSVATSTLSAIETKQNSPNIDTLIKISEAFDITLDRFIKLSELMEKEESEQKKLDLRMFELAFKFLHNNGRGYADTKKRNTAVNTAKKPATKKTTVSKKSQLSPTRHTHAA